MFNTVTYIKELDINPKTNEELQCAKDHVELTHLVTRDPWLARQAFYGMAGAMERQIEYLGSTLLPSAERRLTTLVSDGVMGESYVVNNWFGNTNDENNHINTETVISKETGENISVDQQVDDQQVFIAELNKRMETAAIIFVCNLKAHDEMSKQLNQLTYSGIKAKANTNRQQRTG